MSATGLGGTDVLDLGADWESQGKNEATNKDRVEATGNDGDCIASIVIGTLKSGTVSYIYIGAETDFASAFDAAGCNAGQAPNSLCVTQIDVDYSPCAEGKKALVTFSYRGDIDSASNTYSPTISLPVNPSGIPDLLTNSDGDSECTSAKYTIRCDAGQDRGSAGAIIAGATYHGEEQLDLEFYGIPTLISSGWDGTTDPGESDSNSQYSTSSYSFVKGLTRDATTTTT
jgi:hypothetical protein